MRTDLNEKYRPKRFADFWNQGGAVQTIIDFLRAGALPKALFLWGNYGVGKTSLCYVLTYALSCLRLNSIEPCGECGGCIHCFDRFMSHFGGGLFLNGNKFQPEVLDRFVDEATNYQPPDCSNTYLVAIDEFDRMPEKVQESLLHIVERTPRTHFVLCANNNKKVSDGIKKRTHELLIAPPTLEQACSALRRIALAEDIKVSEEQITEIARENSCIPRDCLKALQKQIIR